jgi:hypothetical protein
MICRQLILAAFVLVFFLIGRAFAQEQSLSGDGWYCWLDKQAEWKSDKLHLPGVDLKSLPTNEPTGGWGAIAGGQSFEVAVPSTVEAYKWGHDSTPYGVEGNYQGVSWWSRSFDIPKDWKGQRILLKVGSAVLRSEVFVNHKLVGYDAVGNTPFEMDITDVVEFGRPNHLAIRVTDPFKSRIDGIFDWQDYESKEWGDSGQRVPCTHGFGGITGDVTLRAVPKQYIDDIFMMNKPSPSASSPTDVDIQLTLKNITDKDVEGCSIKAAITTPDGETTLWETTEHLVTLKPGEQKITLEANCPDAKLWDIDQPNLYRCTVTLWSSNGEDEQAVAFGFRWFGPEGVGERGILTLNGRRIVCRTAISWGFFPVSGTVPPHDLATKQMDQARTLGLNMMTGHRTIAHPRLLRAADSRGLMYYCEPGGYLSRKGDEFTHALAREKLLRMVRRDRNHPCVVWWNMVNEPWFDDKNAPSEYQFESLRMAHAVDPTRIITWGSGYGHNVPRGGAWMAPYNDEFLEEGYYDQHWTGSNQGGPTDVYEDSMYKGPDDFPGNYVSDEQIVFFGEENAVSSPPQLGSLVEYYKAQPRMGWAGHDYIKWYEGWAKWLEKNDTHKAFEDVNALCRSIGNNSYFRNAKVIETLRADNKIDGYAINGWECEKFENYSGIVDIARNFKGDPAILAEANRPHKVVVLPRTRVTTPGEEVVIDFGLINEVDFKGDGELEITVTLDGEPQASAREPIEIKGGITYGQFLLKEWSFTPENLGRYEITGKVHLNGEVVTDGVDHIFITDLPETNWPAGGAVLDDSGVVAAFLKDEVGYEAADYDPNAEAELPFVIIGDSEPTEDAVKDLAARVKNGMGLVILETHGEEWISKFSQAGICKFDRRMSVERGFKGGNLFALKHEKLLAGLPQAEGMNWEYQAVSAGRYFGKKAQNRYGLVMECDEVAAGSYNQNETDLGVTLGVIHHGQGRMVISTLRIVENLDKDRPPVIVPKQLLCNYVSYATEER